MLGSKVKRTFYCNLHTTQRVESICINSGCMRPILCLECLSDGDIHDPSHKNIVNIDEFCDKIDEMKSKYDSDDSSIPRDISDLINDKQKNIENIKLVINKEKEDCENALNEMISSFTMLCYDQKERIHKALDSQIEILEKNYDGVMKFCKKIYPPKPQQNMFVNLMEESSHEELNKSTRFVDLEEFVKKYHDKYFKQQRRIFPKNENLDKAVSALRDSLKALPSIALSSLDISETLSNLTQNLSPYFQKLTHISNPQKLMTIEMESFDSKIAKAKDQQLILSWFPDYKDPNLNLLYRATRDGFESKDFHSRCNNAGPTFCLFRSSGGKRFGGYSDISWDEEDKYTSSSKSFLFSLDLGERYPIKKGHEIYALRSSPVSGPCFGGGYDLKLNEDFKNKQSMGYIGFSYDTVTSGGVNRFPADVYGNTFFSIEEMEVFQIRSEEKEIDLLGDLDFDKAMNEKSPSVLASDDQFYEVVDMITNRKNIEFSLLYRASRDGFSSKVFHEKCDGKGPTLIIIKSKKYQHIFGGYTQIPWKKTNDAVQDKDAFVFSITKKKKFAVIHDETAIFRAADSGPVFGNGDIYICSDCNSKNECYSNLGSGYNVEDMSDSNLFLADEMNFSVEDYEVFRINIKK